MEESTMFEVMEEFQDVTKTFSNEGSRGVKNLCQIVNAMGYKDPMHFGQFEKASYGDLIAFLEDNPGAIEAIKEWIVDQNIQEWKENMESYLPAKDED